jgi:hypothetical protein
VFGAQRFPPALQELIDEGYVTAISEDKTADLFATASTKFSSTLYKSLALSGAIAGVTSLNMEEVFTNMPVVNGHSAIRSCRGRLVDRIRVERWFADVGLLWLQIGRSELARDTSWTRPLKKHTR